MLVRLPSCAYLLPNLISVMQQWQRVKLASHRFSLANTTSTKAIAALAITLACVLFAKFDPQLVQFFPLPSQLQRCVAGVFRCNNVVRWCGIGKSKFCV